MNSFSFHGPRPGSYGDSRSANPVRIAARSAPEIMFARLIACAITVAGVALASGCKTMEPPLRLADVEAVERARFQALTRADTAAMRPMLADDLVYCHTTGQCQNKEEAIADVASKARIYHSMKLLELKLRAVAGAVVINGKVDMRVEAAGRVSEFQAIYTDVYAKRNGRWQMVSWQSTRLP
jgi:ketosteroid isomerase-like protein